MRCGYVSARSDRCIWYNCAPWVWSFRIGWSRSFGIRVLGLGSGRPGSAAQEALLLFPMIVVITLMVHHGDDDGQDDGGGVGAGVLRVYWPAPAAPSNSPSLRYCSICLNLHVS